MQTTEELNKKMLTHQRIQTAVQIGIFILLLIGLIFLITESVAINDCLVMVEEDLKAVDMTAVNDAVAGISDVADQLGKLDLSSLDGTINALTDAADNLSRIDISNINKLIESVQSTASKLESVSATLSRLASVFG